MSARDREFDASPEVRGVRARLTRGKFGALGDVILRAQAVGERISSLSPAARCWGVMSASIALAAAVLGTCGPALGSVVHRWVATWHLLAYQDGVRRRALTGTLFRGYYGEEPISELAIALVALLAYAAYAIALSALFGRLAARNRFDSRGALVYAMLLVAPTGLPFLAQELGRHDVYMFLAMLGVAGAAQIRHDGLRLAGIAGVVGLGMLAHEAFLVGHLPTTLAILALARSRRGTTPYGSELGVAVVTAVLAAGVIAVNAHPEADRLQEVVEQHAAFQPSQGAVRYASMSLAETAADTWEFWGRAPRETIAKLIWTISLLLPIWLAAAGLCWRIGRGLDRTLRWALVLAPFSVLLLAPIALDWARWAALATNNLAILGLVSLLLEDDEATGLSTRARALGNHALVLYVLLLGALTAGSYVVVTGVSMPHWLARLVS